MERLHYALKQKAKATKVFTDASHLLQKSMDELHRLVYEAKENISELQDEMAKERDAIEEAVKHLNSNSVTLSKINDIIGKA